MHLVNVKVETDIKKSLIRNFKIKSNESPYRESTT